MRLPTLLSLVGAGALLACARPAHQTPEPARPTVPVADYHTHLFTQSAIARVYAEPLPRIVLPPELDSLLERRKEHWNDPVGLAAVYADSAIALNHRAPAWIQGGSAVAEHFGRLFARAVDITPVAFGITGNSGFITGYYSLGTAAGLRHYGHVHLSLSKTTGERWRIAAETPAFPGPKVPRPYTAEQLIAQLDTAGIQRALVLSTSYWFQSGQGTPVPDEVGAVRAEHAWLAAEVAKFPGRLTGFCALNPLRPYVIEELRHCARSTLSGVKLHLGDGRIDLLTPAHLTATRRFFAEANALRYPIMVHVMTGADNYGAAHSRVFLDSLVAVAPDIHIQIAHLAGSGPGYWNVDSALAVFAEAAERGDSRMRNVYLDVATIVTLDATPETLAQIARRIRQLGVRRVLFGSDYPASPELTPRMLWAALRLLPLTDEEFRIIAGNVTPYLR